MRNAALGFGGLPLRRQWWARSAQRALDESDALFVAAIARHRRLELAEAAALVPAVGAALAAAGDSDPKAAGVIRDSLVLLIRRKHGEAAFPAQMWPACPIPVQMWQGASPVPAQMWQGASPVPAQMCQGVSPVPAQMW